MGISITGLLSINRKMSTCSKFYYAVSTNYNKVRPITAEKTFISFLKHS